MTRREIKEQLEKLGDVFETFAISQKAFDIWVNNFKDYDKTLFCMAIDEVIKNEEFAPRIATINKYYHKLEEERNNIISKAREAYYRAIGQLGQEKNVDDYKAFLTWLSKFPMAERLEAAESFGWRVVGYANAAITKGEPLKPFIELLEGEYD